MEENVNKKDIKPYKTIKIDNLMHSIEEKDPYTKSHSDRVSKYCVLIGKKLGLSDDDLNILEVGGLFHDIGKIDTPDNILFKKTKLDNTEYEKMKQHTLNGVNTLSKDSMFNDIIPIVLHHHEKFDGSGYPSNLAGNDIPILARITAIADTFDAMTSNRTYRNALPLDTAKEEIRKCSGTQFDPEIVSAFLDILENDYDKIKEIQNSIDNKNI